ncbi:lipopolysaccharide biosynthesis protein [Acidocella sp.]|uniref:lipopolysaccharide biosynthesis protein n=1 Tax=Acidocella sp. TaxID=50710 RepID=UPI003D057748
MSKLRNASILRTSLAGVVQRCAQLLSSLVTLPVVLHSVGVAGFGVWGAATSLAWLTGLLTLGLGGALITLIPRGLAMGRTTENRGYVTASLQISTALATALLLGSLTAWLAGVRVPSGPFLVAGAALIFNIPLNLHGALWLSLHKGHMAAFWATVQTLLGLAFILLGASIGAGVTFMVAAIYGALLLSNAGSLAHVLYLHHHIRPFRQRPPTALRTVMGHGGLLFTITIASTCATAFDNVFALVWLGPTASAQMAVAMRVCVTAIGMVGAVTQAFWPSFVDAFTTNDKAWTRRTLRFGTAAVVTLSVGGSGLLVAFGAPTLRWWLHQNLHISAPLLWAMAAWITGLTLTDVPGALLNATLKFKPQIALLSLAAAAGFGLKFLVAHAFGVPGILLVTPALWFAFVAPIYFWMAWRTVSQTS